MKNLPIISLALGLLGCSLFAGQEYHIISQNQDLSFKNHFQINEYSFIHALSTCSFESLGLQDKLSRDDLRVICCGIIYNVSPDNYIQIQFPDFLNGKTLIVTHRFAVINKKKIFLITSNFDLKRKRILGPGEDSSKTFAKGFFYTNNRLTDINKVYTKEKETKLRSDLFINLADYYIFDDLPGNDEKAEEILQKGIRDETDPSMLIGARLTLAQYYLSKFDYNSASRQIEFARNLVADHSGSIDPSLKDIMNTMDREFYLTRQAKEECSSAKPDK